ncbi:small ligand-binding sensory domain FIST [Bradyrhizobium sp. i1.3.6]
MKIIGIGIDDASIQFGGGRDVPLVMQGQRPIQYPSLVTHRSNRTLPQRPDGRDELPLCLTRPHSLRSELHKTVTSAKLAASYAMIRELSSDRLCEVSISVTLVYIGAASRRFR